MPSNIVFPALSHAHLSLDTIDLSFGDHQILHHVDLQVTPTSRIGIVGENGRGKTSLLHILSGHLTPDAGSVRHHGTIAVAEQEMPSDDARTVGDAIAETIAPAVQALAELDTASEALATGEPSAEERFATALEHAQALDAWDARRRVQVALEALEAETDDSVELSSLSVGQRYRVRLACLLGGTADFLLLDEPTNHLDRAGLEFLTEKLRTRHGGVVLVSHDRALLSDVAETILSLDPTPDDRPRLYGDGYAGYRDRSQAEREHWEQRYAQQQTEHAKLTDDLHAAQDRLVSGWRPPKGSGKHRRATRAASTVHNVQRRQAALEAHALSVPEPPLELHFPRLTKRSGPAIVTAEDVMVDGRLQEPVNLSIAGGDRLVITGPNGAGKSTLLNLLAQTVEPTSGTVHHRSDTRVALLHQESQLPADAFAGQWYRDHLQRLIAGNVVSEKRTMSLRELGLLGETEARLRIGELSMGQQRRLDLALVLALQPHVLLLDEPTNHLSIRLVDELTVALEETGAAVVLATHDRQLLRDTAHWPTLRL